MSPAGSSGAAAPTVLSDATLAGWLRDGHHPHDICRFTTLLEPRCSWEVVLHRLRSIASDADSRASEPPRPAFVPESAWTLRALVLAVRAGRATLVGPRLTPALRRACSREDAVAPLAAAARAAGLPGPAAALEIVGALEPLAPLACAEDLVARFHATFAARHAGERVVPFFDRARLAALLYVGLHAAAAAVPLARTADGVSTLVSDWFGVLAAAEADATTREALCRPGSGIAGVVDALPAATLPSRRRFHRYTRLPGGSFEQ